MRCCESLQMVYPLSAREINEYQEIVHEGNFLLYCTQQVLLLQDEIQPIILTIAIVL